MIKEGQYFNKEIKYKINQYNMDYNVKNKLDLMFHE